MNNPPTDSDNNESNRKVESKIQGAGRLAVDAVSAVTDIVESLHSRISPITGVLSSHRKERVSGIGGLVYRNIRQVTDLAGKSIDIPLAALSKALNSQPDSLTNHALLSALNGVLGDHLHNRENPLAIEMQFRVAGQLLAAEQLAGLIEQNDGKLLIMVHGLCMNDLQWDYKGHDHGAELAKELGMAVVYLHYNTGRHISENGNDFDELLEFLTTLSDKPLHLNIVAHSMGGLVSRSAYHTAEGRGHIWPSFLDKLVFLGTPHHGAALEKTGNWIDLILGAHFYTAPLSRLIKVRSSGITDLRYGNLQESDWLDKDRFEFTKDPRRPMSLPVGVQCYAVATSAGKTMEYPLGDGLVSIDSALGKHNKQEMTLDIPNDRQWTGTNINHMQLLGDKQVYSILLSWFASN